MKGKTTKAKTETNKSQVLTAGVKSSKEKKYSHGVNIRLGCEKHLHDHDDVKIQHQSDPNLVTL